MLMLPIEELLLPGHTKQMHLYDRRQVDTVDAARSRYCGLFALVYVASSRDEETVLSFASVAEITASTSLGDAGRIIVVRSVGRVRLDRISMAASTVGDCAVAAVQEVPEICSGDDQLVEPAIEELMHLLATLDVLQPNKDATLANPSQETQSPSGLRVRTQEQDIVGRSFEARWDEQITRVALTLSGVALASEEHVGVAAWPRVLAGVALLYGLLGAMDLATRVEYFTMPDQILTARLRYVLEMLREKQGMARARRAIAAVFDSATTDDDGGSLRGNFLPPGTTDQEE